MSAYKIRRVLEHHFWFFATENSSFLSGTPEEAGVWAFFLVDFFPLEIVSQCGGINDIKSLGVFDFCS